MPKRRKNLADSRIAPTLPFDPPEDNLSHNVRASLVHAIRQSNRSVEQIADAMSVRLQQRITHHMIYSFCSEGHAHRFPLEWAAVFCRETRDYGLIRVLMDALELPMPEAGDGDLIQYAKEKIAAETAALQAEALKARILRSPQMTQRRERS